MQQLKDKIDFYETMRAIAMLSVIIGHVTSPVVKMSYGSDMSSWWVGNIISSAMHFGVPIFLLLSGATMLLKDYKLIDFYKKRFVRVLLPFVFWALAYIIYRWLILNATKQPYGWEEVSPWLNNLIFNERISLHFWYIYMILAIYVFMPFLAKALRLLSDKFILLVLILWAVLNFSLMFSSVVELMNDYILSPRAFLYCRYSGYLVLGYYLRKKAFDFKYMRIWSVSIYLLVFSFVAIYTYYASKYTHKLDLQMHGNLTLISLIKTLAFYFLIATTKVKNAKLVFIRDAISNYSYGIYLVHIMVIGVLFLNGIFWTMMHPLISLPVLYFLVFIISIGIIFVLRKIPGGKHISG